MSSPPLSGLLALPPEGPFTEQAEAIALTGVEVHARVQGPTTRVRVTQRYENRESVPIEATYVFPLPEGAAVCGFSATLDGHRLEGVVKEQDEAFDDYDDAMVDGRGAFLLDQERPDIFTASVGNLLPGQTAEIELQWVAELPREDGGFRLAIPSSVSPRYVPLAQRDAEGMDDAERISPPVTTEPLPYGLRLLVDVDLLGPIRRIESPSHRIRVELEDSKARVELAGDEGRLDRDVVLHLVPAEQLDPLAAIVSNPQGERFAVATLTPRLDAERVSVDAVFVVDCSGSMMGVSVEQVRQTLRLCLRSLHPGDRFDIVRFGSTFEHCFGELRNYDDESMSRADAWLKGIDADLGGTEILAPLQSVLERMEGSSRPHRVILITDGQVSDEDQVIALAQKHREHSRIFGFGMGYAASEHLLRGCARASGGASEMIAPGESIETKVLRQLRRMSQPTVEELRLEWDGLGATDVSPCDLRAIYDKEPLTLVARITEGQQGTVRLRGRCAGKPWECAIDLRPEDPETAEAIVPTLWARRRIQELEEGALQPSLPGSRQHRKRKREARDEHEATRHELIDLGRRFGLLSSATSYVIVDDRPDAPRAEIPARLRRTPTALTFGWHGITNAAGAMCHMFCSGDAHLAAPSTASAGIDEVLDQNAAAGDVQDPDHALLMEQLASGAWELSEELTLWADVEYATLDRLARALGREGASLVVATLLVLHRLDQRPEGIPESWEPAIEKARQWLETTTKGWRVPDGASSWEEWLAGKM